MSHSHSRTAREHTLDLKRARKFKRGYIAITGAVELHDRPGPFDGDALAVWAGGDLPRMSVVGEVSLWARVSP